MSLTSPLSMDLPKGPIVQVNTTANRGFTTDELAQQCVSRLISISEDADPALREQAKVFEKQALFLIKTYLDKAVQSDRTTLYNRLSESGQSELAELIRRI